MYGHMRVTETAQQTIFIMDTFCPLPLWPETRNCSGRGLACISNECICGEGWTGLGDFVAGRPTCDINITAIQGLWTLVIVCHSISILIALVFFQQTCKDLSDTKRTRFVTMRHLGIILLAISASALMITTGTLRIVEPLKTIGTDPKVTVVFSIGACCFWTWSPTMAFVFISLNARQLKMRTPEAAERIRGYIARFQKILPLTWVITMISCVVPMFMLINSGDATLIYALTALHYLGITLTMAIMIFSALKVLNPLTDDINQVLSAMEHSIGTGSSSNSERLRSVAWRIGRFKKEIVNQIVVQGIIAILFGLFPYVQRLASYQLPIAWAFTSPMMIWGLYSISSSRLNIPCLSCFDGDHSPISQSDGSPATQHHMGSPDRLAAGKMVVEIPGESFLQPHTDTAIQPHESHEDPTPSAV